MNTLTRYKNKTSALLFAAMFALLPFAASAQTADFDPQPVILKIGTYVGYGLLMIGAWILGKWTLKSLGVIGGK